MMLNVTKSPANLMEFLTAKWRVAVSARLKILIQHHAASNRRAARCAVGRGLHANKDVAAPRKATSIACEAATVSIVPLAFSSTELLQSTFTYGAAEFDCETRNCCPMPTEVSPL